MARLHREPLVLERPSGLPWGDYRAWYDEQIRLIQTCLDPDAADLTGALVRFQVADGYAFYVVAKHRPLTLRHVLIGDAWEISGAHIRGLREADIRSQLRRDAALKQLFAEKKAERS